MGSCVSVHKNPESAMRFKLSFGSKTDKLDFIPSPLKDKPISNGERTIADVALKSQWSPLGSKDENFYDSQPWLESDCEDDFLSVNGDFTPSRGSTPVHQSSSMGILGVTRSIVEDKTSVPTSEPSPTDKKKKLADLFEESLHGGQDIGKRNSVSSPNSADAKTEAKGASFEAPQNSVGATPYASGANSACSSERIPNGDLVCEAKSARSAQCCLPRLLTSRSFTERKKKSPTRSSG